MDDEPIPFAYEIAGCVNGAQAALRIEGSVASGEVRFETKIACSQQTLLWDETILALAAIDSVVLMSFDPDGVRRNVAPEIFRVESGLFDDGEKAIGRFVLSGCWSVEKGRISIRAQIVEGWMNFEPMERVTHVGVSSPMSVLSAEKGRIVATRVWRVETSRGNTYSGVSVASGRPLALEQVKDRVLRLRWTGVAGGEASEGREVRAFRVTADGHAQP